ncbi:hypothetical protein EV643_15312 [Kribbella sp. VKM Ac-2527]|uniref:XRE family transcriptional regulator n=1 Tax=Kribbella caucasensis TaxID=2512215 RepID=A0A4R6IYA5_9ACTN|nr:hypothetical protein [Kribbella sp. VKM Ac-2527]TDO27799.1 hypothetical protein EV643_15312 [Kribbella sp. VKM Ac-2527]
MRLVVERDTPRTLLEQLIRQRDQTVAEAAQEFGSVANQIGEAATLSPRHLRRLMSGDADNAYPSTRRVAQQLWGAPFEDLVGPARTQCPPVPVVSAEWLPHHAPTVDVVARGKPAGPALMEELELAAEESARFVRHARGVVSQEVLEQLEADVIFLAEQYMRRSPYAMFRPLAELRREVFSMLDGHPRPEQAKELYRIAGQVSALLAHLSSDLGHAYGVETHTRTALICADLSGVDQLRGYARWVQAQVAYWQGDYRRSADLSREGQMYVRGGSDLLRLTSQEARSLAALGDEQETGRALRVAADARAEAAGEIPAPGAFYFAPGKAAYYAAEAHLALGGPDHLYQAVGDARESLELFGSTPGSSAELVAAAQLDLVTAHVALDDLDSGAAQLADVLQLPAESRTVPVIERSTKIGRALRTGRYANSRIAAELRDQLEQFVAYPAARDLPELSG